MYLCELLTCATYLRCNVTLCSSLDVLTCVLYDTLLSLFDAARVRPLITGEVAPLVYGPYPRSVKNRQSEWDVLLFAASAVVGVEAAVEPTVAEEAVIDSWTWLRPKVSYQKPD